MPRLRAAETPAAEGKVNGRGPQPFTLPESGVVVQIIKPSFVVLDDYRRSLPPPPEPPIIEVEIMGKREQQENPNDPDFIRLMNEYISHIAQDSVEFAIQFGVLLELDDAAQAAVARARAWAARHGIALPEDDKVVYVSRVLAQGSDVQAIHDAVFDRLEPSEEATAAAVARFPAPL